MPRLVCNFERNGSGNEDKIRDTESVFFSMTLTFNHGVNVKEMDETLDDVTFCVRF